MDDDVALVIATDLDCLVTVALYVLLQMGCGRRQQWDAALGA
jgi:hypothetical protein